MNWKDVLGTKRAHHGGSDDASILDFSANTNPHVPDGVEAVYHEAFGQSRRYPVEPPTAYQDAAASYVDCEPSEVIPTPGGLAAIRLVVSLTVEPGDTVLVPAPSFAEYAREVRLQGGEPSFVSHQKVLDTEPAGYALAIVCTPNNPTGNMYSRDRLEQFADRCRRVGTPLLVDEAFLGYTDQPSLAGTDGVVVARSLTKLFGLPGIRAGFAVATDTLGESLGIARRPWNVSQPALATGAFCMRQDEFVRETRSRIRAERARMRERLDERFEVYPSESPFLLLDVGTRSVEAVLEQTRARGVVVRDATTFRGLDSHIRVAVKCPAENDQLLAVFQDV